MKKILSLLLAIVLVFTLMSACAQPANEPPPAIATSTPSVSNTSEPDAEPVVHKISILNPVYANLPPDIDVNNNKWTEIFSAEFPNLEIEWILVPGDDDAYNERKLLMMGSGDYPDVVKMLPQDMTAWADMGLIQPLEAIHDTYYPNVYNFMTQDDLKTTWYNGQQWGIKTILNANSNPRHMYMRTDWLDNLGLSMPKTIDELYDVLYAFTFNDPDQNGVQDTFGVIGASSNYGFEQMWPIWTSFGVQPDWWTNVNGQIIPDAIRPEYKEALGFFRRLWADGIMDKDTLMVGGAEVEQKGTQGSVGLFGMWSYGVAVRAYPNMLEANPNAKLEEFLPIPVNGRTMLPLDRNGGSTYGITIACDAPEVVLSFFNWLISEDESTAPLYTLNADKVYLGEIGVNSIVVGDRFVVEMPQADLSPEATVDLYRLSYRFHMGTNQGLPNDLLIESNKITYDTALAEGRVMHPTIYTAKELTTRHGYTNARVMTGPVYADKWTDIETHLKEIIAGIITGSLPMDAFDSWVEFFYNQGGQDIIDEITAINS